MISIFAIIHQHGLIYQSLLLLLVIANTKKQQMFRENKYNYSFYFFLGFLWHEIKQCYQDGLKDYLLSWNNIIDLCMNILYLASFTLKYYVFYEVRI